MHSRTETGTEESHSSFTLQRKSRKSSQICEIPLRSFNTSSLSTYAKLLSWKAPPPLTFPQKPSCPDDLRNANIPQKLANGRCGSVHVFRREKGAPSTEVRGTGLVVERLHGGGWSRSGRKSSRNGGNVFSIRSICCCIPLEIPWGRATPCLSVPHTLRDHHGSTLQKILSGRLWHTSQIYYKVLTWTQHWLASS